MEQKTDREKKLDEIWDEKVFLEGRKAFEDKYGADGNLQVGDLRYISNKVKKEDFQAFCSLCYYCLASACFKEGEQFEKALQDLVGFSKEYKQKGEKLGIDLSGDKFIQDLNGLIAEQEGKKNQNVLNNQAEEENNPRKEEEKNEIKGNEKEEEKNDDEEEQEEEKNEIEEKDDEEEKQEEEKNEIEEKDDEEEKN